MEWCQNGDLEKYIIDFRDKVIPELKAIELMEQVIQGYRYLVEQGILHRDLKPANILRSGSTLKIADFGFAVKGKKTLIDSMSVGTPLYMPP
jgi:serine/threonine protein kinase